MNIKSSEFSSKLESYAVAKTVSILSIPLSLAVSLIITTTAALNMVEKKRMSLFIPFIVLGLGICLSIAFIFYDFFGVATDIFYIIIFVSVFGMFLVLRWCKK